MSRERPDQKLRKEKQQSSNEVHRMLCPGCGMELLEIKYRGREIDKFTVRWRLDRRKFNHPAPLTT